MSKAALASLLLIIAAFGTPLTVAAQGAAGAPLAPDVGEAFAQLIDETHPGIVRSITRHDAESDERGGRPQIVRQQLEIELRNGDQEGRLVTLRFDGPQLEVGDRLFVHRIITIDGEEYFQVEEIDRRSTLLAFVAFFILAVVALGRWRGVRALASLAVSIVLIVVVLVPRILAGGSPLAWGAGVAIAMLLAAIGMTHGIHRSSLAAFLGTAVAVAFTAGLATAAVALARFSGLADDATFFLDIETGGAIDLRGLLLAAIIIGAIGVLDDVAVTQAAAVEELHRASPVLSSRELYQRALRIGREHVGALVNTLALAYVGAALPLLLLFRGALQPIDQVLNREMIAAEIVRTIVGSIGVIAAVPLTTWFAVLLIRGKSQPMRE